MQTTIPQAEQPWKEEVAKFDPVKGQRCSINFGGTDSLSCVRKSVISTRW